MQIALRVICVTACVAASGCSDHKDCGPSACGPCKQQGCVATEKCVGGQWECSCVCPDGGCGPSPCGACKQGCAAMDKCVGGQWQCSCVCPDGGQRVMPDYLKGTVTCGTTTCAEGSVCIDACVTRCSGPPDGGSCPAGCNLYPNLGCYSCVKQCLAVPPRCYTPCPSPNDPTCDAPVTGCSATSFCDGKRQMSCGPT